MGILARFLQGHPGVEALQLEGEGERIQVAALGPVDWEELEADLRAVALEIRQSLESGAEPPPAGIRVTETASGTRLEKPTCPTAPRFWQWRELPFLEAEEEPEDWRELARDAAICGASVVAGFVVGRIDAVPDWIGPALYAIGLVAGGRDAAVDTWAKLRKGQLDIHFLMLAVALGAVCVGAWGEAALLLFLFSASGAMEAYATHRTRNEIGSLLHAAPRRAIRLRADGTEEAVGVEVLQPGDLLAVRPGDLVAVDATVAEGDTAVDESALTGESVPVPKGPGDEVYGGTLNTWGSIRARVVRPARQSALQKIIDLIRHAQARKAPSQRLTDRFGTGYTWVVLGTTAAMFFIWWLLLDVPPFQGSGTTRSAFYRAMTLLVVMSPCALVLSIPSAILAAIASGARRGILFRGGAAVEKLAAVDTVAFDKTGTLTTGELEVVEVGSLPPGREREILELACSLEAHASHPIARAILKHGRRQGIEPRAVESFQSHTGQGVSAREGEEWTLLGRREMVAKGTLRQVVDAVPAPSAACSEVWVLRGGLLGRILLRDRVRTESAPVLRALRATGLKPCMLTGDRAEVAAGVGAEIGLAAEEIEAGLMPEGKVAAIRRMAAEGRTVAMVGDGVNDAPSLAAAHVSVAMGARGSDAALEQSEVVLMNDRIDLFLQAYRLSRKARAIIRQNLVVAFGTVLVMAVAAVTGRVPLSIGVLAHEGSTVLVCLNSLRLLWTR